MPNQAPDMKLTATPMTIKLPNNKILLSSSGSTDVNRRGRDATSKLQRWYYATSPLIVFQDIFEDPDLDEYTCEASLPNIKGTYILGVEGTDIGGLTGKAEVTITVEAADIANITAFGASGDSIPSADWLANNIAGTPTCSRTATRLDKWKGERKLELERYIQSDKIGRMYWNINRLSVPRDALGNKTGAPIIKAVEIPAYQRTVDSLISMYKDVPKEQKDKIILLCENEITTTNFYDNEYPDAMNDYGRQLRAFGDVCNKYGFKWGDSGVHVTTVNGADDPDGQGKSAQVAQLLQIFSALPDMHAVMLHANWKGGEHPVDSPLKAVNKIRTVTGHETEVNEWHLKSGTYQLMQECVISWNRSGIKFCCYISGTTQEEGSLLNVGDRLTDIGAALRDGIKNLKG